MDQWQGAFGYVGCSLYLLLIPSGKPMAVLPACQSPVSSTVIKGHGLAISSMLGNDGTYYSQLCRDILEHSASSTGMKYV